MEKNKNKKADCQEDLLWDAYQEVLAHMNEDDKAQGAKRLVMNTRLVNKSKIQVQIVVTKIPENFMEFDVSLTKTIYTFSKPKKN